MTIVLGTVALVIVIVAIGMLIDRRFGILPAPKDFQDDTAEASERKKLATHGAGEAPATALQVREAQIARLRTSQRCSTCRAAMTGEADDTVRYDETDLLVLHFTCPICASKRALYLVRVTS